MRFSSQSGSKRAPQKFHNTYVHVPNSIRSLHTHLVQVCNSLWTCILRSRRYIMSKVQHTIRHVDNITQHSVHSQKCRDDQSLHLKAIAIRHHARRDTVITNRNHHRTPMRSKAPRHHRYFSDGWIETGNLLVPAISKGRSITHHQLACTLWMPHRFLS